MAYGETKPVVALIEDNTDCRELLSIQLQEFYEVVCFSCVRAALKRFEFEIPAIILTDLLLPDQSGWDLLREARARGVTIPIVAVSAYVVLGIREKVIKAGFDEFIAKPILDVEAVVEVMNRLTRRKTAA